GLQAGPRAQAARGVVVGVRDRAPARPVRAPLRRLLGHVLRLRHARPARARAARGRAPARRAWHLRPALLQRRHPPRAVRAPEFLPRARSWRRQWPVGAAARARGARAARGALTRAPDRRPPLAAMRPRILIAAANGPAPIDEAI